MRRGQNTAVVIVISLLIVSGAFYYGGQPANHANKTASAVPSNSASGVDSLANSVYLMSKNSSLFPTPVWFLSKTPSLSSSINQTEITLSLNSATSGLVLFHPGENQVNQQTASISPPTNTSAYGWITSFYLNTTIPAGNWSLDVGINRTTGTAGSGSIMLNANAYVWNATDSSFTLIGTFQNSTLNLVSSTVANMSVNLSGKMPEQVLNKNERIFVEYYISLSGFLSTTTKYTFVLDSGGSSDSSYFVKYPHFGWLNGSVSPANATVTVNGSTITPIHGGLFNLTLGQGTYWINVSLAGYSNHSSRISIVSGFKSYLNVTLQRVYAVNVTEKGLSAGTQWSVNLSGMVRSMSANYTRYLVVNGTYHLIVGSVSGYHVDPYPSNVTINGSARNISLTFTVAVYGVIFNEKGLSLPQLWGVSINSVNHTSESYSISVNLSNGTYNFTVLQVPRFAVTPSSGSFKVSGNASSMTLIFTPLNYTVFFRENGLPIGAKWSVTLNGVSQESNRTVITFNEPEGTYYYAITVQSGYRIVNSSGTVAVSGGNVTVNATFLTVKATPGNVFSQPQGLIYFLIVVIVLVQVEVVASMLYFRRNGSRSTHGKNNPSGNPKYESLNASAHPVSQILAASGSASAAGANASFGSQGEKTGTNAATLVGAAGDFAAEAVFEYGCTYAVFEETAEKSISLFEVALKKGLRGICFTREYPDKLFRKHDLTGATVIWLSNIGSQNSIRPKDLEKITLQCNEALNASQCIIMIDGLEYLITNNGFISVLKLLQFLRDATAVNSSILIISINQHAIKDSEVSLLRREVDRTIE